MKHTIFFTLTILFIMSITGARAQNADRSVEIIRYTIASDRHANFEEAYKKAGKLLDESAFCLGYHVIHGEEEPDHYIVVIDWKSTEGPFTRSFALSWAGRRPGGA